MRLRSGARSKAQSATSRETDPTPMAAEPETIPPLDHWLERLGAVGRAQHRYMYLLALLILYFGFLHYNLFWRAASGGNPKDLEFLSVSVPPMFVWTLGPPSIAFVLLAFLGSLSAAGVAFDRVNKVASAPMRSSVDRVPNMIDLAFFTKPSSHWIGQFVASFSYPSFASAALLVAGYLWICVILCDALGYVRWVSVVITFALLVGCCFRLRSHWKRKIKSYRRGRHLRRLG